MDPSPKHARVLPRASALLAVLALGCSDGGEAPTRGDASSTAAETYDGVVRDRNGDFFWSCTAVPPVAEVSHQLTPIAPEERLGAVCITGDPVLTFADLAGGGATQAGGAVQAVRFLAEALGQAKPDQVLESPVLVAADRDARYEEVRTFLRECCEHGIGIREVLLLVRDADGRQRVVPGFLPRADVQLDPPAATLTVESVDDAGVARVQWEDEEPVPVKDLGSWLSARGAGGGWVEVALDGKLKWSDAVRLMDQALDLDEGVALTRSGFRAPLGE